jgi:enoyl-CoA hydratase
MDTKYTVIEIQDNIAIVKINRPGALNALNQDVLKELEEVFYQLRDDDKIKVVIITGEGKAFVAGADIAQMKEMSGIQAREFSKLGQEVFALIESIEKPVIAAINGFALGGGSELAMACDIRIASDKAKIGQPEVNLGIIPGFGGTQRLSRIIGPTNAKMLIYTGDMIDAQTALDLGLVNKVVPAEELMKEALDLAKKITFKGPNAIKFAKAVINKGIQADLLTGSSYEMEAFGLCFSTGEAKEGMSAFLEKRKPNWK